MSTFKYVDLTEFSPLAYEHMSFASQMNIHRAVIGMLKKYSAKIGYKDITCEPDDIKVYYEINIDNCREFPLMYSIKNGICFGEIDIYECYDKKSVKKVLRLLKDYKKISSQLYALLIPYLKEEF